MPSRWSGPAGHRTNRPAVSERNAKARLPRHRRLRKQGMQSFCALRRRLLLSAHHVLQRYSPNSIEEGKVCHVGRQPACRTIKRMLASALDRESILSAFTKFSNLQILKMKKIFLGVLAIALCTAPAFAIDGGKRKKNKANVECQKGKCCEPGKCSKDPKCPPVCKKNK